MLKENKFLVLKEKGRSGRVSTYLVEDNVTGERAYLKTFQGEEQEVFNYITEMNCLKDAGIEGILTHLEAGIMEEECGYYMLFSEVGGPTLEDFLEMGAPLTESEALRIGVELRRMLESLHENDCLHLFLCARNVFYSPGKPLVVKDPALTVGMYELLIGEMEGLDYSGLSPGLMDGEEPSERDDAYALGALMRKVGECAEWNDEGSRASYLMEAQSLMNGGERGKGDRRGPGYPEGEVRKDGADLGDGGCTGREPEEVRRHVVAGEPGKGGEEGAYRPGPEDDPSDVVDDAPDGSCSTGGKPSPLVQALMNGGAGYDTSEILGIFGEEWSGVEGRGSCGQSHSRDQERTLTEAPRDHGKGHSGDPIREEGGKEIRWRAAPLESIAYMTQSPVDHPGGVEKGGTGRTRKLIAAGAAVIIAALAVFTASYAGGAGTQGTGGGQTQDAPEPRGMGEMGEDGPGAVIAATPVSLAELMAGEERTQSGEGVPTAASAEHEADGTAAPSTAAATQEVKREAESGVSRPANQPPRASFTVSPNRGPMPLQVCLDASASADPDGTIVSYAWSCGGSGPRLLRVFESQVVPASISITLTVTDDRGASSSTTRTITLY